MQSNKAFDLATRAIANPELISNLSNDKFFTFVMMVAKYHKDLAIKLEEVRPFTNPQSKVLFWEGVGIILCNSGE